MRTLLRTTRSCALHRYTRADWDRMAAPHICRSRQSVAPAKTKLMCHHPGITTTGTPQETTIQPTPPAPPTPPPPALTAPAPDARPPHLPATGNDHRLCKNHPKTQRQKLTAEIAAEPDLVDRIFDYILAELPEMAACVAKHKAAVRAEFRGEDCYIAGRPATERQQNRGPGAQPV
jgi:hypothetical protein